MLFNDKLLKSFSAKAASTTCFIINWSPSIAIIEKTQIKVWSGTPAVYSYLNIFGCIAYSHVDNGKLEPRYVKCVFLSY